MLIWGAMASKEPTQPQQPPKHQVPYGAVSACLQMFLTSQATPTSIALE